MRNVFKGGGGGVGGLQTNKFNFSLFANFGIKSFYNIINFVTTPLFMYFATMLHVISRVVLLYIKQLILLNCLDVLNLL